METLEILQYPDPRLRQISEPISQFDQELHKFLDTMAMTMYRSKGVGLAAPQVGRFIRCFLVDISTQDEKHPALFEFINPTFSNGSGSIDYEEGCLSLPGVTELVRRHANVKIDYQDRHGKAKSLEASGLLAVATQHENDHLDGILFLDHLSPLKRRLLKRKFEKQK